MPASVDHLVLAVPDLDEAVEDLAARTGVRAVPGGSHPGLGTRNALVALRHHGEDRCYLELLARDPAQPDVAEDSMMLGFGLLGTSFTPHLLTWAARPTDLDATLQAGGAAGLDAGVATAASRETPAGTRLSWRLAVPDPLGLGGVQPFLIDWQGGAHPSEADLPRLDLLELQAHHPDPAAVAEVFAVLDVDVPVVEADAPGLRARLGTPRGVVELS